MWLCALKWMKDRTEARHQALFTPNRTEVAVMTRCQSRRCKNKHKAEPSLAVSSNRSSHDRFKSSQIKFGFGKPVRTKSYEDNRSTSCHAFTLHPVVMKISQPSNTMVSKCSLFGFWMIVESHRKVIIILVRSFFSLLLNSSLMLNLGITGVEKS